MYVVTVTFRLHAAHADAFLSAIQENARLSVETEPGCRRFDVAVGEDGPETVFLYELYSDRAAFDAHLESEHFKAFDSNAADWIAEKDIRCYLLAS